MTPRTAMTIEFPWATRPPEEMRCPTCGARQGGWADACRRCKSDLRMLRAALETYERHWRGALLDLDAGRTDAALHHARRCHELRPGPESHRLMAVCQLLRGDWAGALEMARRTGRVPPQG
jgi:hypothetical protein